LVTGNERRRARMVRICGTRLLQRTDAAWSCRKAHEQSMSMRSANSLPGHHSPHGDRRRNMAKAGAAR